MTTPNGARVRVSLCVLALANKAKKAAEGSVVNFHAQLNAAQYHDIYSRASDDFQKSGTEAEITEFFAAVHRKLGNAKDAKEQSFFVNFTTAGTVVTLTYKTEFDSGSATEQFVWKGSSEPVLVNYRIDSRALITK
jgi:hypothetical protein